MTDTRQSIPVNPWLRRLAGVALAAMAAVSGASAWHGFGEGATLSHAAVVAPGLADAKAGRADGAVKGELLNPPAFPEVKDALVFRVRGERLGEGGYWQPDERQKSLNMRAKELVVGGVAIVVGDKTTLATPTETAWRTLDEKRRLRIDFQPAPERMVAIGAWKDGAIRDSSFVPLILVLPETEAKILTSMTAAGRLKGVVLSFTTLMFGSLALLALWIRKPRDPSRPRAPLELAGDLQT